MHLDHRSDRFRSGPTRPTKHPEEAAWVREHLDEVQKLRSERGVPLLDPADPKAKERYGL
jgi:hypothetical protein